MQIETIYKSFILYIYWYNQLSLFTTDLFKIKKSKHFSDIFFCYKKTLKIEADHIMFESIKHVHIPIIYPPPSRKIDIFNLKGAFLDKHVSTGSDEEPIKKFSRKKTAESESAFWWRKKNADLKQLQLTCNQSVYWAREPRAITPQGE